MTALDESLEELDSLAKLSKEEFMGNKAFQGLAKWHFYVMIQGCLDLGNHVISIKRFEMPERYEDILSILEKNDIVSNKLADSLEGIGNFRNLIAHGYFKIDLEKLYGYLKKINDVKKYLKNLEPYLQDK